MTFENYLINKHADQYVGIDDDMPEDYNTWTEELDIEEWIELAEAWHLKENNLLGGKG